MHELSIVANLFEILEEQAKEKKAKKITLVRLRVGVLSGVVPEFLETAFNIYKKSTIANQARLEIEKIPLEIECQKCHQRTMKEDFVFICEHCGSRELKTLRGTDLLLERMELEV
jgi:hydrogenase nickel incorporation protein HypA/HybF